MSPSKMYLACVLAIGVWFFPVPAPASLALFLKIDGIDGESTQATHKKWINVSSWNLAISTNSTATNIVRELVLTKNADSASPKLWLDLFSHKNVSSAQLDIVRSDVSATCVRLSLSGICVTAMSATNSATSTVYTEAIKLKCSAITYTYWSIDSNGTVGVTNSASF